MSTTLGNRVNTYNMSYDNVTDINAIKDLNNKLFCTFTDLEGLDVLIENIKTKYDIIYNKLFVLEIKGKDEYVVTYNVDQSEDYKKTANTILIHRKKDTNTLYTVNALNEIIKAVNNGVLDKTFVLTWENYKNSLLLTNNEGYRRIVLELYKRFDV